MCRPAVPARQVGSLVRPPATLELDRPTCLLLNDDGTGAYLPANDQVTDFDPDHVAATQLAIDSQVEQRPITQPTMLVKEEADSPNLSRLQRPLRTDFPSNVPCRSVRRCGIELRHTHDHSPMAGTARGELGGRQRQRTRHDGCRANSDDQGPVRHARKPTFEEVACQQLCANSARSKCWEDASGADASASACLGRGALFELCGRFSEAFGTVPQIGD